MKKPISMLRQFSEHLITPDWDAPPQVKGAVTTRLGGVSHAPYESFNLALHVGDDKKHVVENRALLSRFMGQKPSICWLNQIHGTAVLELDSAYLQTSFPEDPPNADAAVTSQQGMVCAVMTADCLPVIFAAQDGSQVAAAHAGWRGLCAGILEQTVARFHCPSEELLAWFGPAIGPENFEVGPEVREAFLQVSDEHASAFVPVANGNQRWMADLYQLAKQRLNMQGVARIFGGNFCTFAQQDLFYSYRRDGSTGRMATLVWIDS